MKPLAQAQSDVARRLVFFFILIWIASRAPADVQYWLEDVPDYDWYHGCSPTSGGMVFGYWDNQPG